jgi:DNA-binding winged helix-turn-helix (wHTH) protein/Tfp pilus assembly protein PilF/TolB-like protein
MSRQEKNLTYQFGEFALEPHERRLLCEGKPIALTPKVFDTLVLLVEGAGHVAKKEDLLKALWPRGYVDEATLSNHIWQIRRALGDSAKTTRFIETLPKVGYRFVATVTVVEVGRLTGRSYAAADADGGAEVAPGEPTGPGGPAVPQALGAGSSRKRPAIVVSLIALGLAAIALLTAALLHFRSTPSPEGAVTRSPSTRVVALVGFNNLTRFATDAWLAPALTTMIGTELATVDEIRIVPYALVRDATKGLEPPIAGGFPRETLTQLRKRLDADYIISGSYLVGTQADDPSLRIDVVLQDAQTGSLVAVVSNQTGLSELNRIINQTGATLRGKLGATVPNAETLSSVAKAQPPTTDVARHVALALDDMERHDAARARDELLEAVAQSPGYAPAYLYLSQAWSDLGYRQKALAAADQASLRAAILPAEQRLQVKAAVQTAAYQWKDATATWKELVAIKPVSVEYRIGWIDSLIAAGEPKPAQAALAELQHLPRSAGDPRVSLVAARLDEERSDTTAAAQHAATALRDSQLREAPGLIADSEVELATAEMRRGKYEDARKELDAAIVGYQALDNPHGEVAARRAMASTYTSLQRGQDAREEYQRAMALAQSIGDIGGVAAVYRDICSMLWLAGDRDGAQAAHAGRCKSAETPAICGCRPGRSALWPPLNPMRLIPTK